MYKKKNAIATSLKKFGSRYDDVLGCSRKLAKYFNEVDDAAPEATRLNKAVDEVLETFHEAIEELDLAGDKKQLTASNKAYEEALGGEHREAKFMAEWRKFDKVSKFGFFFRIFADPRSDHGQGNGHETVATCRRLNRD